MKTNDKFVLKHVLDADILVDIESNFNGVYKLNETSKKIYEYINDGKNINEIIDNLSKEYGVDKTIISRDVSEFVEEMIKKGIFING